MRAHGGRGILSRVMAVSVARIRKNLEEIRRRIAEACSRVRRDEGEVSIVAVTKEADMATVRNAVEAGLKDLGENRVQQLVQRRAELDACLQRRRGAGPAGVRWHMVGHLQRNKVRHVIRAVEMIHSVDSLRLAEEISDRASKAGCVIGVLLQVNCSREPQKSGVAVGAAIHLAELICTMKHLRLRGLMTMAAPVDDMEKARAAFVRLRELFEEMRHHGVGGSGLCHLSMGMTQDYPVAVEEGATILRIGTALFR